MPSFLNLTYALFTSGSVALTLYGSLRLIPEALEYYGRTYFEWPETKKMNSLYKYLGALALSLFVIFISLQSQIYFLPGIAMIVCALYGTFVVDRAFSVIPDRLHALGLAGTGWIMLATYLQAGSIEVIDRLIYGPGLAGVLWLAAFLYEKWRKTPAMGLGDIKLFAWLGLFLSGDVIAVVFLSMIAAMLWNLPSLFLKRLKPTEAFAFGPFIAFSTLLFLWF